MIEVRLGGWKSIVLCQCCSTPLFSHSCGKQYHYVAMFESLAGIYYILDFGICANNINATTV